ncbi:MAG TPA: hypothetical protein VFE62_17995 [Gemmataceae bacterium]|nr:hypothetical protein [Gemmataceae bacterium]
MSKFTVTYTRKATAALTSLYNLYRSQNKGFIITELELDILQFLRHFADKGITSHGFHFVTRRYPPNQNGYVGILKATYVIQGTTAKVLDFQDTP